MVIEREYELEDRGCQFFWENVPHRKHFCKAVSVLEIVINSSVVNAPSGFGTGPWFSNAPLLYMPAIVSGALAQPRNSRGCMRSEAFLVSVEHHAPST